MIRPRYALLAGSALLLLAALAPQISARAQQAPRLAPPPALDVPAGTGLQTAILSGGCFWGVQGVFEHVRGVRQVVAGYSGGEAGTARYDLVSTGATGHAESVKVTFDPKQISYGQILRVFFSVALDPTMKDAQGPDEGPQYRSEIFYTSPDQKRVAEAYLAQLTQAHLYDAPIATRIDPLSGFYDAERYHQSFLQHHPNYPYIVINDMPKVDALKRLLPAIYQSSAQLSATSASTLNLVAPSAQFEP